MSSFEHTTGRIVGLTTATEIIDAYPHASHAELMRRILARAEELAVTPRSVAVMEEAAYTGIPSDRLGQESV